MSSSDSDGEGAAPPPAKRQRRFAFKTFQQRVSEVDVDVYRRAAGARQEPLPGAACFTAESLAAWRELNTAADFTEVAAEIHNLASSLPLLLHHKDELADLLLARVHVGAMPSLEPILGLIGTLARDLRADFLPLLPRVLDRITELVETGGAREPELMQHAFACVSSICKHLQKPLAADIPTVLALTARLRYHDLPYIRGLAANAVGLLFRHASSSALRAGVRVVAAEAAARPAARTEAAGQQLAAAVKGVSAGLHSRAGDVWGLLLREDLLRPSDFKSAAAKLKLTGETLRDRTTAVAAAFVHMLLRHVGRPACGVLWAAVLAETERRLQQLDDAEAADAPKARASVARAASLVADMAAFHHGSRVDDWPALCGLTTRLLAAALPAAAVAEAAGAVEVAEAADAAEAGGTAAAAAAVDISQSAQQVVETDQGASAAAAASTVPQSSASGLATADAAAAGLMAQALRLLQAVLIGHCQAISASDGLQALQPHLPAWGEALARMPAASAAAFVAPLLRAPAGGLLVQAFAGPLLGALGRAVLIGDAVTAAAALPLLEDTCLRLRPQRLRQPALHLADGCGAALAEAIRAAVTAGPAVMAAAAAAAAPAGPSAAGPSAAGAAADAAGASGQQLRVLWAQLRLLPHACADTLEVLERCVDFAAACKSLPAGSAATAAEAVSLLRAEALRLAAGAASIAQPSRLPAIAAGALAAVRRDPRDYHAVAAAAALLSGPGVQVLTAAELPEDLLGVLTPNLSNWSAGLRRESLRLLCAFRQPLLPAAARDLAAQADATIAGPGIVAKQPEPAAKAPRPPTAVNGSDPAEIDLDGSEDEDGEQATARKQEAAAQRSDVLPLLLALEEDDPSLGLGRQSAVTLRRMGTYLEYGRVPAPLLAPLVHALLGSLHIRLSTLWPAATEASAKALEFAPEVTWPLVLEALRSTQAGFLSGSDRGAPALNIDDDELSAEQRQSLAWRFERALAAGSANAHGGATDAAVRLSHLLKALAKAPAGQLESHSRDWVPLLLAYSAAKASGDTAVADAAGSRMTQGHAGIADADAAAAAAAADSEADSDAEEAIADANVAAAAAAGHAGGVAVEAAEGVQQLSGTLASHVGGRAWRAHLKEWLAVVGGLKGGKGLARWREVRRAVALQLGDTEPAVQQAALRCLKAFKVKFVTSYMERLLRLADNASLRSELAQFPLAADADDAVLPEHRPGLSAVLARLLFPKLRKRTGRLGGRGAPGSARAAILNFFAAAPPPELQPLLELFLEPLAAAIRTPEGFDKPVAPLEDDVRLVEAPWWGAALQSQDLAWWLEAVDAAALAAQPLRRRVGLLHAAADLLKHLGHRMQAYLPPLLALVLAVFEQAAAPLLPEAEQSVGELQAEAAEGARELRSGALGVIASVLRRFPAAADYSALWPRFFVAAAPLMPRLVAEASADKAPPLLEVAAAIAAAPELAPLLGDQTPDGQPAPWATEQHLGSRLLSSVVAALGALHCGPAARDVALSVVEALLQHQEDTAAELAAAAGSSELGGDAVDAEEAEHSEVLAPHATPLLAALRAVVLSATGNTGRAARGQKTAAGGKGRKYRNSGGGGRKVALRALAVLEMLARNVSSAPAAAAQLGDALLPLLGGGSGQRRKGKGLDESAAARVLGVLAALWRTLPPPADAPAAVGQAAAPGGNATHGGPTRQALLSYVSTLAPLGGSLEGRAARQGLAAAFEALATGPLPELRRSAALLAGLVAMSASTVDEADYDARLAAYSQLTPQLWAGLPPWQAAPLVHASLADLRNPDDIALRHAAAQALERLVDGAAAADAATEESGAAAAVAAEPGVGGGGGGGGSSGSGGGHMEQLLQRLLLPRIKAALGEPNLAVRQEHLALLRRMATVAPARFADLALLSDANEEQDFFANVAHLQLHRRVRAFARLCKVVRDGGDGGGTLGVGTLLGIAAPLLQQAIVAGRAGEGGGHELKDIDRDKEANVVAAAVAALGTVAAALPWPAFSQLLGRFLRLLAAHGEEKKGVVRAVCAIIDAFRFLPPVESADTAVVMAADTSATVPPAGDGSDAGAAAEDEAHDEDMQEAADAGGTDGNGQQEAAAEGVAAEEAEAVAAAAQAADIRSALLKRVLPGLKAQLVAKGDVVRAPVGLAVVKVLRLVPEGDRTAALPGVLQSVANLLKSRMQGTRDEARKVFVAMVAELGAAYLPYAAEVLQGALPDKGYTAQVRGYTLHALLEALAQDLEPGGFDNALAPLLPLVEGDIFGAVAEAKEVAAFAGGLKEAKKQRGYESYRLLAQGVTFRTHAAYLLSLVRDRLPEAGDPKIRNKLAALLQHAARGVAANPTAALADLLLFCQGVLTDGLTAEEAAVAASAAAATAAVPTEDGTDGDGAAGQQPPAAGAAHEYLLVEFALTLLHGAMKRNVLAVSDPEILSRLDALLPLLARALKSRHSAAASLALRCLCHTVRLPLPGLQQAAGAAGAAAADILTRTSSTATPLAQDSLKLLAGLLMAAKGFKPSEAQLSRLLKLAFEDIEEAASRQTAFTLLRAVLSRRLVVAEVYDIMGRVQTLLVRAHAAPVRQVASAVLMQFLLDYPVGGARLKRHLAFLLSNLAYEHEEGRLAVLDTLNAVVAKFPQDALDEHAEILALPLVARLVNDPSPRARSAAAEVVKSLLAAVSPPQLERLAGFSLDWLSGSNGRLRRAACQVFGLLAEQEGRRFGRRMATVLPPLAALLTTAAAAVSAASVGDAVEAGDAEEAAAAATGWQEPYAGLLLFERLTRQVPVDVAFETDAAKSAWRAVAALGLHAHAWVRSAAARLLGAAFAHPRVGPPLLAQAATSAGRLAYLAVQQLEAEGVDEALAKQAVKNAVFLVGPLADAAAAASAAAPAAQPPANDAAAQPAANGAAAAAAEPTEMPAADDGSSSDSDADETRADAGGAAGGSDGEDAVEAAAAAEAEEAEEAEAAARGLSAAGLMRRMARLADERSFHWQTQRAAALRFIAAAATRLGADRLAPHLPTLLRPLYRISEGASTNPEEIQTLGAEVLAHLRTIVPGDTLVAGLNAARADVAAQRQARRQKKAVQAMLDPGAAAAERQRKAARKAAGRKRKLEDVHRRRGAGLPVKNRRKKGRRGAE